MSFYLGHGVFIVFLSPHGIVRVIDLLAILQKSLDRALFLYNFIWDVRSSGVRASFTIVHIRKCIKASFDSDSFLE